MSAAARTEPPAPRSTSAEQPSRRSVAGLVLRWALLACASAVVFLWIGGGRPEPLAAGLPYAGNASEWGLLLAQVVLEGAAILTAGLLVLAAFLQPARRSELGGTGLRMLRLSAWTAATWAVAAVAVTLLTLADVIGRPLGATLRTPHLLSLAWDLPQTQALIVVAVLAATLAILCRLTITVSGAGGLAVLAGFTVLPPAVTGHAASLGNHDIATDSLIVHILAVCLWVGGLLALVVHVRRREPDLAIAAGRFSRMALWCFVAVGASGVVNAAVATDGLTGLVSRYGALVAAKTICLVTLGVIGYQHRRRTLPAVAAGVPRAFARLAGVEALVMAVAVGLGAALARTPPPAVPQREPTNAELLLGYPMPAQITLWRVLTDWRLDLFWVLFVAGAAALYLAGVHRLLQRGDAWPLGRTVSWSFGLILVTIATLSGMNTYGSVLFSVHMLQHMTLTMLAPIFLVLGAPITLALRAIPPATPERGRGAREWVLVTVRSPVASFVTHPVVVEIIFIVSIYGLYFTGVFQSAMLNHWSHLAMHLHFLLSGYLFFWVLVGIDPAPHRVPYWGKVLMVFTSMPLHAFFGVALMSSTSVIAEGYYEALARPWGGSLIGDQQAGGGIAWAFGEIPALIVMIVIFTQWVRADERIARRSDRAADRASGRTAAAPGPGRPGDSAGSAADAAGSAGEATAEPATAAPAGADPLVAYNAYLARLAEQDARLRASGR